MKTAIITGITGQDGAYLTDLLINKGYTVIGLVRSYSNNDYSKLKYLNMHDNVIFEECDLLDISNIIKVLLKHNPNEVYNLAAQSSVGLSFEQPIGTIQFNLVSVLNLLESIKLINKNIRFYQASSSEMFGKVELLPITEDTAFHPVSPYAVSKASAHWTVVNYREAYGIFACCGILFNHESYLRSENFFTKKVIRESINISRGYQDYLKVGNIDIKRDFGYAPKYVEAMHLMLQQDFADDFIVCSGSSISLRDIIHYVFNVLNIPLERIVLDKQLYRPLDIYDIYGDNSKALNKLGWNYDLDFYKVLDILINEEMKNSL